MNDIELRSDTHEFINEKLIIRQLARFIYEYMMQKRDKEIARIFMIEDRLP